LHEIIPDENFSIQEKNKFTKGKNSEDEASLRDILNIVVQEKPVKWSNVFEPNDP
jgi:hypothetical protein